MLTYIVPLLDIYNKIYTTHGTYYIKLRTVTYFDITKHTEVISEVEQLTERKAREKHLLLTFPRTVTAEHCCVIRTLRKFVLELTAKPIHAEASVLCKVRGTLRTIVMELVLVLLQN